MSNKRMTILLTVMTFLVVAAILFLLSLYHYLRISPHPQLKFMYNKGWVLTGDCAQINFSLGNGSEQQGYQCDWRLINDSYFTTTGDPSRIAPWCNQQGLNAVKGDWDVDWRFFRFNYNHAVPLWWDGCPKEVVIESGIHIQVNLK